MNAIDEQVQRQSIFEIWPDSEYPGLHRDIRAAIAAAVLQEREACRTSAVDAIRAIRTSKLQDSTMAELRGMCADASDAVIRARGNGGK